MAKILITGAAGAIGYHLAKFCIDRGDQVFLVDNFVRSKRDDLYAQLAGKEGVKEINIDLRDASLVAKLPIDIDYIYHLSALNGTQNFYESPFDVLEHCTIPTINLLHHYAQSKFLTRFLYAGSSEAYASTVTTFGWKVPTDEQVPLCISDPLNVRWSYGASKMHGEIACVAAAGQFGTPFTVARFHNVYGPRMGDKHVIPDFLERARNGIYELYGFEDTRSFIYVSDAVRATVALAETDASKNEIVNIGGPDEITMLALGEKMMQLLGIQKKIVCHPSPNGSVKRRSPDLAKLLRLTEYVPEVSMDEGLKRTIEYYLGTRDAS